MRLRKILAASMAATVAISSFMFSMTAEATYASPTEMIEEILYTACTGIDIDAAWATLEPLITVDENEIKLNGVSIGYWDSDTIYSDSSLSTVYAEQTGDGVECNKTFLSTILDGLNQNIVENYVPTTGDWSKIIGHYDITFGTVTVPSDQWVSVTPNTDPLSNGKTVNLTRLFDVAPTELVPLGNSGETVQLMSYLVDSNGDLYLSENLYILTSDNTYGPRCSINKLGSTALAQSTLQSSGEGFRHNNMAYVRAGLVQSAATADKVVINIYETDTSNSNYACLSDTYITEEYGNYVNVTDASLKYTGDFSAVKDIGIIYISPEQYGPLYYSNSTAIIGQTHNKMFESYSCSKRVIGNTKINKRLSKLNSLEATDTVTIKTTGWYVNGNDNIDTYIAVSTLNNPGSAEMLGTVEVEELKFKVIVPAVLPMSADPTGEVVAATNAAIQNLSNASVKITDLAIAVNAESGWTMVDTPSKTRGDNEFSFDTSLRIGNTIEPGESLGFTYDADMSPAEKDVELVDMVTMTITLDWEE